jgi:ribose-phosphate pyrophosphokinase
MTDSLCLFALHGSDELGSAIAAMLGQPLAAHEEREFEDGEHKARAFRSRRGCRRRTVHAYQ